MSKPYFVRTLKLREVGNVAVITVPKDAVKILGAELGDVMMMVGDTESGVLQISKAESQASLKAVGTSKRSRS